MAIFDFAPCFLLIIVLVIFGLDRLAKSSKTKGQPQTTMEPITPKRTGWIVYLGTAFIIAFLTVWGALFFLAIVWLLRMDPKPYSPTAPLPSDLDRDSIKSTYTWLLISPVLTIPTLFIVEEWLGPSINDQVLAALLPLIFHTPLLFRLNTKHLFVYRHTQLAILLVALRAGMTALALNTNNPEALFLLGNGSLWLFGTLWARNQVIRSECWLMERKGEKIILPNAKPDIASTNTEQNETLKSADARDVATVREQALQAFRTGTPEMKKRAFTILTGLGEVEKF